MLKALLYKELRETGWITLLALAAYFVAAASCAGYPLLPIFGRGWEVGEIPFLDGSFITAFCWISVAYTIALGFRQTAFESARGTWVFLLHRPASIRYLFAVKLAVGAASYLLCGAVAILGYAAWAATPGKHASPFEWWMTAWAWRAWAVITLVYLGAFLAGIRPARWFGTRLLPLPAAGIMAPLVAIIPCWPVLGVAALAVVCGCLVGVTYFVVRTRDF